MARYYEIGRFSQVDNEIDWASAMFHEENAADLGVMEAILTMANICLGIPHDVLVDCTVQVNLSKSSGLHLYCIYVKEM